MKEYLFEALNFSVTGTTTLPTIFFTDSASNALSDYFSCVMWNIKLATVPAYLVYLNQLLTTLLQTTCSLAIVSFWFLMTLLFTNNINLSTLYVTLFNDKNNTNIQVAGELVNFNKITASRRLSNLVIQYLN